MKNLLTLTAVVEAATGMALVVVPLLVARLLFGAELSGVAIPVARVAGIALIALGLACWPGKESTRGAAFGMTTYNTLTTFYLAYLGFGGKWIGPLLWPAVVLHVVLTLLLVRAWFAKGRHASSRLN